MTWFSCGPVADAVTRSGLRRRQNNTRASASASPRLLCLHSLPVSGQQCVCFLRFFGDYGMLYGIFLPILITFSDQKRGYPDSLVRFQISHLVTWSISYHKISVFCAHCQISDLPLSDRCNCVDQVRKSCCSKKICNDKIRNYFNRIRKCMCNVRNLI